MKNSRLRVWLPVVQLVIAATLTASNLLRPNSVSRPSWTAPDRQICDGFNAPAALIRFCLLWIADRTLSSFAWLDFAIETVIYLGLVGLLWYLVSLEIAGGGLWRWSVLTARTSMRTFADLLAMLFGITLAIIGQLVRHQFGGVSTYSNLISVPYFLWAIIVFVFYGFDLWVHVIRRDNRSAPTVRL